MNKYICIHGHFYQPPRENPWLDEIEQQESAHPYHDWNERITAECYAHNMAARILDHSGKKAGRFNNYEKMNFNFGPTLLSWMQRKVPNVYHAILQADKASQESFSGHGSAIAQVFNHLIMPLANNRDKRTQVIWGIKDFEYRFQRKPEGMWLPETAVDSESLEVLAEEGIKFTILAPRQAQAVRQFGDSQQWIPVNEEKLDTKNPYLCKLSSGKEISIFFYNGTISRSVAFEGLLHKGDMFLNKLLKGFDEVSETPQLVHMATDGETYGHHHKFGDMALAFCLHNIEKQGSLKITNYSEYLEKFPPKHEVKIVEESSWSCLHGIDRWRGDCGCNIGAHPDWNQQWRAPLREALDWLREKLIPVFETRMALFTQDPWAIRDAYIDVILDRSMDNIEQFFLKNGIRTDIQEEKTKVLQLLEMQYSALLMYTSCGWFFDEISGIEAVQVMKYAARAIQLAEQITCEDIEPEFMAKLKEATSNVKEIQNGANVYQMFVKPSIVNFSNMRFGLFFEKNNHSLL